MDGFEASVYDLWILFYEKADFSGGGRFLRLRSDGYTKRSTKDSPVGLGSPSD
ncbi:hypothetical protein ACRRTK_024469 [Alexandromys fortis]